MQGAKNSSVTGLREFFGNAVAGEKSKSKTEWEGGLEVPVSISPTLQRQKKVPESEIEVLEMPHGK